MFEADELPEPKSMLMATAEANNLASKAIAKEFYMHAMEQVFFIDFNFWYQLENLKKDFTCQEFLT